mgnify:CR=1 FL=1
MVPVNPTSLCLRGKRICKLFYPGYLKEYVRHEFRNATEAKALGIRTPQAHEINVLDGREGIVYDRIIGEELSYRMKMSGETWVSVWMDKFVGFHKQLLQYKTNDAMNYKDFLKMFGTDKETIAKIDLLPDDNCFIHGDFHLGNVMIDEFDDLVLVDMMNVCKGPALYDIARTYFLLSYDINVQNEYLERMGYTLESIMPYLDVILSIRENEMKR